MKVQIEVPDAAKRVLKELMLMYEDEGVDTYQKVCEKAIQWYLRSYVQFRNQALVNHFGSEELE